MSRLIGTRVTATPSPVLQVNGKRKRLYFKDARAAAGGTRTLKDQSAAAGAGRAWICRMSCARMAVDCARRLESLPTARPYADATAFYLHRLAAEESARVSKGVDDYLRARQRAGLSESHLSDISSRLGALQGRFRRAPGAHRPRARGRRLALRRDGDGAALSLANGFQPAGHSTRLFRDGSSGRSSLNSTRSQQLRSRRWFGAHRRSGVPADLEALLRAAPLELVPVLAIGAFAGLRTSELLRLELARDRRSSAGSSK